MQSLHSERTSAGNTLRQGNPFARKPHADGVRFPAHRRLALAVFAAVLGADIATKAWAASVLTEPVRVADWLYLMLHRNSGMFLGTVPVSAAYWLCAGAAFGWFGWRALRVRSATPAACLAVILAGLTGNAIGQARGAVVDFIGFGPISGNRWLVANVADLALVGGALVLGLFLVREWMGRRRRPW